MGVINMEYSNAEAPLEIKCNSEELLSFLEDGVLLGKCYPDTEKAETLGPNIVRWVMYEKGCGSVNFRPVQVFEWRREKNVIYWEPVEGACNLMLKAKWVVESVSKHVSRVRVDVNVQVNNPAPGFLAFFAQKLADRLVKNAWATFLQSVKIASETSVYDFPSTIDPEAEMVELLMNNGGEMLQTYYKLLKNEEEFPLAPVPEGWLDLVFRNAARSAAQQTKQNTLKQDPLLPQEIEQPKRKASSPDNKSSTAEARMSTASPPSTSNTDEASSIHVKSEEKEMEDDGEPIDYSKLNLPKIDLKPGLRKRPRPMEYDELVPFFQLPINEAAKHLQVCTTFLKKMCRRNGIARWPQRKLKSLDRCIGELETTKNKLDPVVEECPTHELTQKEKERISRKIQKVREKKVSLMKDPNSRVNLRCNVRKFTSRAEQIISNDGLDMKKPVADSPDFQDPPATHLTPRMAPETPTKHTGFSSDNFFLPFLDDSSSALLPSQPPATPQVYGKINSPDMGSHHVPVHTDPGLFPDLDWSQDLAPNREQDVGLGSYVTDFLDRFLGNTGAGKKRELV